MLTRKAVSVPTPFVPLFFALFLETEVLHAYCLRRFDGRNVT